MKRETLPARRAWPRTPLEMDRTHHLISIFENPYSVGSISAKVQPGVSGIDPVIAQWASYVVGVSVQKITDVSSKTSYLLKGQTLFSRLA